MNSGRCGCASAGTIAGGQQQNMERGVEIARGLVGEGGDHRLLIPNADHPSAVGILHPRLDGPFLHPCGRVWYRREIVRFDDATPRSPRTSGSSPGVVAGRVLGSAVEVAVSVSRDGLARRPVCIQLVSRPQSRGGCRPRSHGGSQQPDGFPGPSGVSAGRGLLSFRGDVRDERRPGHHGLARRPVCNRIGVVVVRGLTEDRNSLTDFPVLRASRRVVDCSHSAGT